MRGASGRVRDVVTEKKEVEARMEYKNPFIQGLHSKRHVHVDKGREWK